MHEPTRKSLAIEKLLTKIIGGHRPTAIRDGHCILCKGDAKVFKDALSIREYRISGMCQTCQDGKFHD